MKREIAKLLVFMSKSKDSNDAYHLLLTNENLGSSDMQVLENFLDDLQGSPIDRIQVTWLGRSSVELSDFTVHFGGIGFRVQDI